MLHCADILVSWFPLEFFKEKALEGFGEVEREKRNPVMMQSHIAALQLLNISTNRHSPLPAELEPKP